MDTDGKTTNVFLLSSGPIPGAAGRWGGLSRSPGGFRDALTQENQATPLAPLQTAGSNTSPRLKADDLLPEAAFF